MAEVIRVIKKTIRGKVAVLTLVLAIVNLFKGESGRFILYSLITATLIFTGSAALHANKSKSAKSNHSEKAVSKKAVTHSTDDEEEEESFSPTKKIKKYLWVDETRNMWQAPCDKKNKKIYKFSDIMEFECIQDGNSIAKGSVLSAAAGGFLFGPVGTLVAAGNKKITGTCSKLQVKISVKNIQNPVVYIDLIPYEVKKDSDTYKTALKTAEEITTVLQIITAG
jgi:hypothetical protein